MNTLTKWLIMFCLIIAAITCYAMGVQAGVVFFIILGFCLEGGAWWVLFSKKRARA